MTRLTRITSKLVAAAATLCAVASLAACSRNAEPQPAAGNEVSTAESPQADPARLSTCEEVEAAYGALVSHRTCSADADCQLLGGSCGVGLGGCTEPVNATVTQAQLGALSDRWSELHCTGGACRCMQPGTATCQAGVCEELRNP
jgi:hypothetical protein